MLKQGVKPGILLSQWDKCERTQWLDGDRLSFEQTIALEALPF